MRILVKVFVFLLINVALVGVALQMVGGCNPSTGTNNPC